MPNCLDVFNQERQRRRLLILVVALMLLLTGLAYWPGLSGGFLFDDFVNLNSLGRYGGVHDLESLLYYLTSGIADPTGRPVAMASFLLDARNWPADPLPFKRTNLALHLVNGLLLYSVLVALGRRLSRNESRVQIAALLATALWLMNPVWVSTVLYVVQRHAMLAALFALAGIRAWIGSRNAFDSGNSMRGWLLAILAVPIFGTLAGLSKANGFLLPMLLAVLELTVLRVENSATSVGRWASRLLVWLPAAVLLGLLCWYALGIGLDGTQARPWTLGQRLLTQPRALLEYLWQLFVPGLSATGVFADGFPVSQGWLKPWTTFPAILVVGLMAGVAWCLRRRVPVLSAALGFFLAGHAMESSVVMLELYFEHRNYLPAMLLFWPLAWWLAAPGRMRRWLIAGAVGYAGLMLLATTAQARLWGDPLALALVWAEQNSGSARAQAYAFQKEVEAGRYEAAEKRLSSQAERMPEEPQVALNLLDIRCKQGRVSDGDVERAARAIESSGGLVMDLNYQWLSSLLLPGSGAACSRLPEDRISRLLQAGIMEVLQAEPGEPEYLAREQRLIAYLALQEHDCAVALGAFDERISIQPRPEFVQTQVALLATMCGPEYGHAHLSRYLDAGAPVSRASSPMLRLRDRLMRDWWGAFWEDLNATLSADASASE